jgi:hypothetical protein
MKLKWFTPVTPDDMEELGYYGNGWLYDTSKPAWWQDVRVGDETLAVVVAYDGDDGRWFCEDDSGAMNGIAFGTTPEEALENWEKGKR